MKRLIAIVLSIFASSQSWAAITRVQKAIADSCATTISANVAGNLLVVFCEGETAHATGVTDNASGGSNTYTRVDGSGGGLNGSVGPTTIWYSQTARSGATTVTCASSPGCYGSGVREYAGALASGDPVDASSGTVSIGCTGGSSCNGATITTTDAGAVIVAVAIPGSSITGVASPYDVDFLGGTSNGQAFADYIPGTTVTDSIAVWSDSNPSDAVGSSVAAFKAAATAAATTGSVTTIPGSGSITTLPGTGSITTRP